MPSSAHPDVARYDEITATIDRLTSQESHYMTPADWQQVWDAQDQRYLLHQRLAAAGLLHLVSGP